MPGSNPTSAKTASQSSKFAWTYVPRTQKAKPQHQSEAFFAASMSWKCRSCITCKTHNSSCVQLIRLSASCRIELCLPCSESDSLPALHFACPPNATRFALTVSRLSLHGLLESLQRKQGCCWKARGRMNRWFPAPQFSDASTVDISVCPSCSFAEAEHFLQGAGAPNADTA